MINSKICLETIVKIWLSSLILGNSGSSIPTLKNENVTYYFLNGSLIDFHLLFWLWGFFECFIVEAKLREGYSISLSSSLFLFLKKIFVIHSNHASVDVFLQKAKNTVKWARAVELSSSIYVLKEDSIRKILLFFLDFLVGISLLTLRKQNAKKRHKKYQ